MQAGRRYTDRRSWEVPLGVMRKIAFGEGSESQKKRKLRENNLLERKESTSPPCSSFLSSHLQVSLWPKIVVSWGRNLKRPIASSDRASSAPDMPSIFPLWAFHSSPPSITARQRIATMSDVPSRTFPQLGNSQCLLATCNVSQVPATPLLWLDYSVVSAAVSSLPCSQTEWRLHRLNQRKTCLTTHVWATEGQQGPCTCAQMTSACLSLCIFLAVNPADVKDPGMEKDTRAKRPQSGGRRVI